MLLETTFLSVEWRFTLNKESIYPRVDYLGLHGYIGANLCQFFAIVYRDGHYSDVKKKKEKKGGGGVDSEV